ncbi:hypothetical protein DNA98_05445 [Meiothermus sp. Pnk-1]|nr:hypothetical protein DNA98_05445 [Meiothermus sp. Pnk-1]
MLVYPYPINAAQLHHAVVVATNVQGDLDRFGLRLYPNPDQDAWAVSDANVFVDSNNSLVFIGEFVWHPRLYYGGDVAAEIFLPPGTTADLLVILDEQNDGWNSFYQQIALGQSFAPEFHPPNPPTNPPYFGGEWIAAFAAESVAAPTGWSQIAEVGNAKILQVFRRDYNPWAAPNQLLPVGTFYGDADTIWIYNLQQNTFSIDFSQSNIEARPGDSVNIYVDIFRGANNEYQGVIEFTLISSPNVRAMISPPAVTGNTATLTIFINPDALPGSYEYVTIDVGEAGERVTVNISIVESDEKKFGLYRAYQRDLSPPWLQQDWGRQWQEELGGAKDRLVDWLVLAVRARYITAAPDDALALIGQDRRMPRYPSEGADAYRARLLRAWDWWYRSGTVRGLENAMAILGYTAKIYELFRSIPARWAEFSLTLRPTNPQSVPNWADDGIWEDDGMLWGVQLSADERARILGVVNSLKAAHSVLAYCFYITGGAIWGETDELWQDDGVWDEGEIVEIYRRT